MDEVAELPISTQVRLLRVLETGEVLKVGSSKVQKTDVRIVAATNVDIPEAIRKGKFREDLYYRLNTVPIQIPSLRERKEDIHLLFRKFASDFGDKYRMPAVRLLDDAIRILEDYRWPGNIRQLKNITEQLSVIESKREIDSPTLTRYLPNYQPSKVPTLYRGESQTDLNEREILYKVLFDMKNEVNDLKKLVMEILKNGTDHIEAADLQKIYGRPAANKSMSVDDFGYEIHSAVPARTDEIIDDSEVVEESLSIEEKEKELIKKALDKYHGRRKNAAGELGISERTLYRKIKEYDLN